MINITFQSPVVFKKRIRLEDLPMTNRTYHALSKAGYVYLDQLKRDGGRYIRGIGEKAIRELGLFL